MEPLQAIVLAIVQGITEFLPISSSAHLILVPELLGWPDQGLAFDVAVHVGTLIAVVAFLRNEISQIVPAWFTGWRGMQWGTSGKLGWLLIIATIPVGLVGLLAGDFVDAHLRSAAVIAASTLVFGLLLGWADRHGEQNITPMESLTWKQTLFVGAAQTLALIPGTSRSGITMTALLSLGYSREASARFSFLMAVPAIALPGLLKGAELAADGAASDWSNLLIGVVGSAVMAFLCMHVFMRFIQKVGMAPFVVYRIVLAVVIMVLLS
ncbi:MAG: undecaprenyl-diphosphatase [Cryomorphaceae bacterium]|jgi:undecaprenyl-diphosphatase